MRTECPWVVVEKTATYSILVCDMCKRETAVGPGERVRPEQFECPFDREERHEDC